MSPLAGIRHVLGSHTQMSSAPANPYPTVPASLNANDHELRDYYTSSSPEQRLQAPAHTNPQYTPYLGLQARLSQTWINKWTILLLLVLFRVLLAIKNLDQNISSAKLDALSACKSVESVGSAMASMPHYLSAGVNSMAADGITTSIRALQKTLMMTLTGVEEIVLFVINMMTSTYICLITLVVTGSISAALSMIEEVGDFMNKTIGSVTSEIASDVTAFTGGLNDFLSGLGSVTNFLGGSKTVPKIDVSSQLSKLTSITIPVDKFDADLEKLRSNLPNFTQVHDFTNSIIRLPFEEVKKLVNESLGIYTFDKSLFPVAQKQVLTFCTDNSAIADFFDGLAQVAVVARKIFIAVVLVLAVLVCIPMAYREIWRYRTMVQRSQLLQKHSFDPMDVMYIASRPYTTTAGIKLASRFQSTKRQILVRWVVAYATSIPALFVLALGVAGLLSALFQYILLKSIEKEVPALAAEVGNFTATVVSALDEASTSWAVGSNAVITSTNTKINQDVFGWVNTTTTAVNATLNVFVDETTKVLNDTFGGTILYKPIMETLNCLVGLKIAGIQSGLTWVHDNAHVTFPEFNKDVFSLGAAAELTNSTSDDALLASPATSTSDDVTGALVKMIRIMEAAIHEEFMIASVLVGIWLVIVLIGIISALVMASSRERTRGEGGAAYTGEARGPMDTNTAQHGGGSGGGTNTFPDFGPNTAYPYSAKSADDPWAMSAEDGTGLGIAAAGSGGNEMRGGLDNRDGEKMSGAVLGQRQVEFRTGHVRSSSYGFVGNEKR